LPFFDSVFDYEALKTQFLEKPPASVSAENDFSGEKHTDELEMEGIIENPREYSEEGTAYCDMQNQILSRIRAGYLLEAIERNAVLATRFRG